MRHEAKSGGALLIGVDLRKARKTVEAAYNDRAGITAKFNLNVLRRLNRELDADFDLEAFAHRAVYDESQGRIEMRLVSRREQTVTVAGFPIGFEAGEHILTEYSHKYSLEVFRGVAERAGFVPERSWMDESRLFSIHYLTVP
jgi:uncharacterized SAM-dependent methyltransferase